jgi:drug/metabolite transporter (DMT)-like permease
MEQQKTLSLQAWAELLLLSAFWGGSFLCVAIALKEMGFMTTVLHRVFWATIILWTYVWYKGFTVPRSLRIWFAFLIMGILNNVIPFGLIAYGQQSIESGLASILNGTTAIFGVILAAMFFADERLTVRKTIGFCFGLAGVIVTVGIDNLLNLDPRSIGQMAVVVATLSYALAGVWAKIMLSDVASPVAAAGMLTGSTVLALPIALALDGVPTFDLSAEVWIAIAYYALFATVFAYLLYYRVLAMAGSGNLMLCTLLIVPFAVTLGALVLNEALHSRAYLGFGLLAVGMAVLDGRLLNLFGRKA